MILGIAALHKCHIQEIQQMTHLFSLTISLRPLRWCASAIPLLSRWAASHCPWHPTWYGSCFWYFFWRHQFVGRYSISMHAYRKWRACWPCVCLVFDVVPFSKSTSHAACVERHECNARAWEKSHAWLWTCSGILQPKDANANRVPLLLRNEKTQPRFVYHMGYVRGLSFHLIPIIWDLQPKTRYYTLLHMSKPFWSLCIFFWDLLGVFISVCCPNATQSPCPKRLVVDACLLHTKYSKIKTPYCRYDIIV